MIALHAAKRHAATFVCREDPELVAQVRDWKRRNGYCRGEGFRVAQCGRV